MLVYQKLQVLIQSLIRKTACSLKSANYNKNMAFGCLILVTLSSYAQQDIKVVVNQEIWNSFNKSEQQEILRKFPALEILPAKSVGVIVGVQAANRSTPGNNSGSILGSTLGQAAYIDHAFKGDNSYSATAQVGAAILGAALGSSFDTAAKAKYVFNYAVKTLDGQIREVRSESHEEFTKPIGQCVTVPDLNAADAGMCITDKIQFIKKLSSLGQAPADATIVREASGVNVNCKVPGVGLMTLDRNNCLQMEGEIEK